MSDIDIVLQSLNESGFSGYCAAIKNALDAKDREIAKLKLALQGLTVSCENCNRVESEVTRLREALRAYSINYPCPGFEVEEGQTSGCDGNGSGGDCPTCEALTHPQEPKEKL